MRTENKILILPIGEGVELSSAKIPVINEALVSFDDLLHRIVCIWLIENGYLTEATLEEEMRRQTKEAMDESGIAEYFNDVSRADETVEAVVEVAKNLFKTLKPLLELKVRDKVLYDARIIDSDNYDLYIKVGFRGV